MPFIGQEPLTGAYHVLDAITASATATYNLQLNSAAFSPATANQLLVSLNGVIQKPGSSFTISGSQITFSSALTSSDSIDFIIALGDVLSVGTPSDGSVNTSQLATSAVTDAKINANAVTVAKMASTLDLSSNTVTLNKNASALVHLATIDASPSASTYEWTMDYDDYSEFIINIEQIRGSSSSTSENLDVKFKMDGTLDDGLSTPYNVDNINLGSGTVRNANNTDNMEWFTSNYPNKSWRGVIHCVNFNTGGKPLMMGNLAGTTSNNLASFYSSNDFESDGKQVTAMRIAFTAGNVNTVKMRIYGVKS